MSAGNTSNNPFAAIIKDAINTLQEKDYTTAEMHLKHAMLLNSHSPEVNNLLGILAELAGDLSLAGKHFRAAYAFDPTYKPASRNLERIGSYYYRFEKGKPDFGDKPEEEEPIPYIIQYDDKNIGHMQKRSKIK